MKEKSLAKQKNYLEAEKVKQKADALESVEQ